MQGSNNKQKGDCIQVFATVICGTVNRVKARLSHFITSFDMSVIPSLSLA